MAGHSDNTTLLLLIIAGATITSFWVGSHLAGLIPGNSFDANWGSTLPAIIDLINEPSNPERAWKQEQGTLPHPGIYWSIIGVVFLTFNFLSIFAWTKVVSIKVKTHRRSRLGMIPEARMARPNELTPLIVDQPTEGRFSIGRVDGQIVATEDPSTQTNKDQRNREKSRVGDRTSVAVFGPTRSGKSATIICGLLGWDGSAIIQSVKADLIMETVKRRKQLGDVYIFDPFYTAPEIKGVKRVSWSPIAGAETIAGAISAASTLGDVGATKDLSSDSFWTDRAVAMLWPLLFAAHHDQRTMKDVLKWVIEQDGVEPDSEVQEILDELATFPGPHQSQAKQALDQFKGWANLDPRPRADQASTAQTLISCWANPYASAATSRKLTQIDLPTIIKGRNTLYIVQPLGQGKKFAPMFGGLVGDLIRDQAYRIAQAANQRIGPTLVVLDEVANTPVKWLPEVASTCAGIGIQLVTIWQDAAQMFENYNNSAQSLINNHGTKIFFAGQTDPKTLEIASTLCGEEELISTSASSDIQLGGNRATTSAAPTHKQLLPKDLLRQIPNGTALLIHSTLPPIHMTGRRAWEEPNLKPYRKGEGPNPKPLQLTPELTAALDKSNIRLPRQVREHLSSRERPKVCVTGLVCSIVHGCGRETEQQYAEYRIYG